MIAIYFISRWLQCLDVYGIALLTDVPSEQKQVAKVGWNASNATVCTISGWQRPGASYIKHTLHVSVKLPMLVSLK